MTKNKRKDKALSEAEAQHILDKIRGEQLHLQLLTTCVNASDEQVACEQIEAGADPLASFVDSGCALHSLALNNWPRALALALERVNNVDPLNQSRHETPLHLVAQTGRTKAAIQLLGAGADIKARTKDGQTPLDYARHTGNHETADAMEAFVKAKQAQDEVLRIATDALEAKPPQVRPL